MQRHSNVSVARFFDWSERDREDCLSVSRLYREIAEGGAGDRALRSLSEKVRSPGPTSVTAAQWIGIATSRAHPGRMFLRDKGMLTKGEQGIIQGICKNRGDFRQDLAQNIRSDFYIRSHNDAWLVGKTGLPSNKPSTEIPRGGLLEVMAPASQSPELRTSGGVDSGSGGRRTEHDQPQTTCVLCMREQQLLHQLQQPQPQRQPQPKRQRQQQQHAKKQKKPPPMTLPINNILRPVNVNENFNVRQDEQSPVPPSSPNSDRVLRHVPVHKIASSTSVSSSATNSLASKLSSKNTEVKVSNRSLVGEESSGREGDSEGSQDNLEASKPTVQVKVYLPTVISEPMDENNLANLSESRPVLARERHLSHSDLVGHQTERKTTQSQNLSKDEEKP